MASQPLGASKVCQYLVCLHAFNNYTMSSRRLQQEFDKLQKKVAEGMQQFEDIHEKIGATENPSLKEKLEGDLRKEIKKLQRSRDQVKQWLGDGSNKLDRGILLELRSRIEGAMERFKEVEKVLKMKQFSNEGLEMQTKLGARGLDEAKKNEAARYITEVLEELTRQTELLQAEVSGHMHKKKLSAAQAAVDELAEKIERNNFHVAKLEHVLRSLENDHLEPERIEDIRDDLDYYVENNQADDFVEYNEFYDALELDESLEVVPAFAVPADDASVTPSPKKPNATAASSAPTTAPSLAAELKAAAPASAPAPAPAAAPKPAAPATAPADAPASRAPPPGLQSKPSTPIPQAAKTTEELKKKAITHAAAGLARSTQLPLPLPVLENTASSFWGSTGRVSTLAHKRLSDPLPFQAISQVLEASLLNCPDSFDLEKPRQYNPVNVHPLSVDYPQEPMYELSLAGIMKKFDIDTLFFCFYYSEGQDNLAKWNAARELSRRGWVFNTETSQWFSKDDKKPRALVVQHDLDSYKYFDYQSTWLIRRKEDFQLKPEMTQTY